MNSVTSFISAAWIFLPRYSGCPAHHQPGDEHRQQRVDEQAHEADADPAGADLAEAAC
jgi:hypothetical protein